jgi:hypothetical protein
VPIFAPRLQASEPDAATPVHRIIILSRSGRAGNVDRSRFRNIVNDLFTMPTKAPTGFAALPPQIRHKKTSAPDAHKKRYLERRLKRLRTRR